MSDIKEVSVFAGSFDVALTKVYNQYEYGKYLTIKLIQIQTSTFNKQNSFEYVFEVKEG